MSQPTEQPPRLLPGPTAWYWLRRATWSLLGAILFAPGMVVGSILPTPARQIVVLISLFGLVVLCVVALHGYLSQSRAEHREREAGYTTLWASRYRDYWQLHPKTGAVIRRPGEEA